MPVPKNTAYALCVLVALAWATPLRADPWAAPGDLRLRHDVQALADAGVIRSPVTSWPVPWGTIAADLAEADTGALRTDSLARSFARLRERLDTARESEGLQPNMRVSGRTDEFWLRTFEDTPREQGNFRAGASWQNARFAARIQGHRLGDPDDGQEWRMDGSYISVILGNHILSAGALDRWWGPNWDNSLILSSNARPPGAFTLERNVAKPFESKWLKWIGPWTYTFFWGFLGDDRVVENTRLLGFRATLRPLKSLEIGLSRTATWCGSSRPCDFDAFWDIVTVSDNTGEGAITIETDPSNQLAAVDARWTSPIGSAPYALYTQWVANDETNNLPSQWFGQGGVEVWGEADGKWLEGDWRAHLELTSTIAEFWESAPSYDSAYNHQTYVSGYRFKDRALGAAADGDSIVVSLGGVLVRPNGNTWNTLVRWENINRRGNGEGIDLVHSVSAEELKQFGFQISHRRAVKTSRMNLGLIGVGIGFQISDNEVTDGSDTDLHLFLDWTWDLAGI